MFNIDLYKQAFSQWQKDNVPMLSAALSYYTVFSAAPLLLISISIAGYFFGKTSVEQEILNQTRVYFGVQMETVVRDFIRQIANPSNSVGATIIGVVTLLLGASGMFSQLKESLNIIFDVEKKEQKGLWHILTKQSSSYAMILVIGFLLLIFLVISTLISVLTSYFKNYVPFSSAELGVANIVVSIFIITILFSLIYIILPDKKFRFNQIWPVSFLVSIMFTLGKEGISFYIAHFSGASTYGAAGSIIIILLWVFYSSQIFFYGAELIKCLNTKTAKK